MNDYDKFKDYAWSERNGKAVEKTEEEKQKEYELYKKCFYHRARD